MANPTNPTNPTNSNSNSTMALALAATGAVHVQPVVVEEYQQQQAWNFDDLISTMIQENITQEEYVENMRTRALSAAVTAREAMFQNIRAAITDAGADLKIEEIYRRHLNDELPQDRISEKVSTPEKFADLVVDLAKLLIPGGDNLQKKPPVVHIPVANPAAERLRIREEEIAAAGGPQRTGAGRRPARAGGQSEAKRCLHGIQGRCKKGGCKILRDRYLRLQKAIKNAFEDAMDEIGRDGLAHDRENTEEFTESYVSGIFGQQIKNVVDLELEGPDLDLYSGDGSED